MNAKPVFMTIHRHLAASACLLAFGISQPAQATVIDATLRGSDAIWLAGRTDLTIPPASDPWPGGLIRHGGPTPEEIQETMPPGFSISSGDVIRVLDPAVGGISFFNGFGGTVYGPDGNGVPGSSSISSFGGISGYLGTQGALVGVFLTDAVPVGSAPATLNFSTAGLGVDFLTLSPLIGQVFYIGNGVTSTNFVQEFTAPSSATRFFIGITDAFGFNGAPGAFDDNDGSYQIRIGVNQDPRVGVPEPTPLAMLILGLGSLAYLRKRDRR